MALWNYSPDRSESLGNELRGGAGETGDKRPSGKCEEANTEQWSSLVPSKSVRTLA